MSTSTERMRRQAQRQRDGLGVFTLTMPTAPVMDALILSGMITREQSYDRTTVNAALARYVEAICSEEEG